MSLDKRSPMGRIVALFVCCLFSFSPAGWSAEAVAVGAQAPVLTEASGQVPADLAPDMIEKMKTAAKSNAPKKWLEDINAQRSAITIVTGRSHLLRFNRRITRISLSDPSVIDFIILSPTEILLNAQQPGTVNLMAWDAKNAISVYDIHVTRDPGLLMALLEQIDTEGDFEIFPSEDVFVIKGFTSTVSRQNQIEQAANAFAEGSVSLVQVRDPKQILLEVRFVQIDNQQDFDFGVDHNLLTSGFDSIHTLRFLPGLTGVAEGSTDSTLTANDGTSLTTQLLSRSTDDIFSYALFKEDVAFQSFFKAIELRGLGRIIARPNLLVRDGEEASFLAGGEFPIVTTTSDSINVSYREFGTRMTFQPEIRPDGTIRIRVEPEVSEIDNGNGLTVNSVTIPAFTTTRVATSVELRDGETFVVGGLIRQQLEVTETGVPFLRRIPIIGRAFESTDYDWSDRELIVTVTPHIIWPHSKELTEDPDTTDSLSLATQLQKFPIDTQRGGAIADYWTDKSRFKRAASQIPQALLADKTLKELETKYLAQNNKLAPPEKPVQIDIPRDLDQLEADLNWPEPGAVAITEEMEEVIYDDSEYLGVEE